MFFFYETMILQKKIIIKIFGLFKKNEIKAAGKIKMKLIVSYVSATIQCFKYIFVNNLKVFTWINLTDQSVL